MPGPCSYSELPIRYGLAEAFIHASTVEQWGLVVNEAMAAGLPVLVQPGVTGLRFDPYSVASIAAAIRWWCDLPESAAEGFAAASQRRVVSFGPEAFAAGLEAAACHALRSPVSGLGRVDRLLLER